MCKEIYLLDRYCEQSDKNFIKDEQLPFDGYELWVEDDGKLCGRYNNARGKKYLLEAVKTYARQKDGTLREVYVRDYPSFPIRGAIEGFYGKPYTFEQRKDLIVFLQKNRMNLYVYAPKDDPFHREKWRDPYPQAEKNRIRKLTHFASKHYVDFCFAISPGKDFDFANDSDYKVLLAKLNEVVEMGVKRIALLMDDIDPTLSAKASEIYKEPAIAHAHLANYLHENISNIHPLLFCPTEYMQNYDTPYRQKLRENLNSEILVFWTGYNTAAEVITEKDGEEVVKSFGRKPIIWDNYPVNDFAPKRRVYFGAIDGRARNLNKTHEGYVANLSSLFESNKIPLMTMAEYAWDCQTYNPKQALERAVKKYFKGCSRAGMLFVKHNESGVIREKNIVKKWVETENFKALDNYYNQLSEALDLLERKAPKNFVKELTDLFDFANAECSLYFAFRGGVEPQKMEFWKETLNGSRYATADLSFLQYLNEKFTFEEPFEVDIKRQIYRRWNTDAR